MEIEARVGLDVEVVGRPARQGPVQDIDGGGSEIAQGDDALQRFEHGRGEASEANRTRIAAGRIRRALRAQKPTSRIVPVSWSSWASRLMIRKPEMTKKTSTPINPPGASGKPAWKRMTKMTAIARRPSTSGR